MSATPVAASIRGPATRVALAQPRDEDDEHRVPGEPERDLHGRERERRRQDRRPVGDELRDEHDVEERDLGVGEGGDEAVAERRPTARR